MIEKKIYRTAHVYITAFHVDFVRRECRVRRVCRHSVEWRQCAERCATEIKVGHLNKFAIQNFGSKSKIKVTDAIFGKKTLSWF